MRLSEIIKTKVVKLEKGLDKKEALTQALKKAPGDYRGFKYNPATGIAWLT